MDCVVCGERLPDGEMFMLVVVTPLVSVTQALCGMGCLIEHVAATQGRMLEMGS